MPSYFQPRYANMCDIILWLWQGNVHGMWKVHSSVSNDTTALKVHSSYERGFLAMYFSERVVRLYVIQDKTQFPSKFIYRLAALFNRLWFISQKAKNTLIIR
eukprot:94506_1